MVDSHAVESFRGELEENPEYRSIDRAAIGGLPLGVLVNTLALRRLRLDPARLGRAAAMLGLGLSVFFAVAPLTQWLTTHALLTRQAKPVADQWFAYLQQQQPERALWLQFAPDYRPPIDEDAWFFYRHDKDAKARLKKFVELPLVRALLDLGSDAQVRFYQATGSVGEWSQGQVSCTYTVTFTDQDGRKKTFLVSLLLVRSPTRREGINPWRIRDAISGFNPNDL